ncbi:MAG: sugar phosphate nucleotidyltransferase [Anaerolineae bacterium]
MKVVIPLAGFGTRLRPHTHTKPKPLFPVAGKPVLGHLIDKLASLDVSEYIFITGYLGDQVEKYMAENYRVNAHYVQQPEMLGQSHAIALARDYIATDEPVFVIFVDTLFETDLNTLKNYKDDALIFVKEVEDPRRFGVAALNSEGYVTHFVEKPATMENKLAVIGLYYFSSGKKLVAALDEQINNKIMTKGEYFLADAMTLMIKGGAKVRTQEVSVWLDAGTPEAVLETNRYLLDNGKDNSASVQGALVIPPVYVHPTATIMDSVIGPHVSIGANAKVTASILRDSIIDDNAQVANVQLETSLVGRNGKVEGRFKSVNIGDTSSVIV